MKLIFDERETSLYEKFLLFESSFSTEKRVMDLGDILLQNDDGKDILLIERKSLSDLIASIKDAGRSEGRIAVLQNKRLQAETETKTVKKTVSLAFGSLEASQKINKAQITLVNEKLANLLEIRDDLKVRQNSGKAQLEEVAQNTLDIANAKIQAISLDSVLLKSKLDYVLLQQRAYEYIFTENEIAQIKK